MSQNHDHVNEGKAVAAGDGEGLRSVPASYRDPESEYVAAMRACALADLSHFGRIEVTGNDRLNLLHRLSTNDLSGARVGEVHSTILLTDKGRIIDRILLLVRETSLLLVTSPGAEKLVTRWIGKYTITEDINLSDVTTSMAMHCILGPSMNSFISRLAGSSIPENRWVAWSAGGSGAMIAAWSDSRHKCALVLVPTPHVVQARRALAAAGGEDACRPIGSIAYEAYRISHGIPARPGELAESRTPYDAGLREDISFTKGCYIGQEVIARLDTYQKIRRSLAGVVFRGSSPGRGGQALMKGEKDVGELTSALTDRVMGKYLGLAVVADAEVHPGDEVITAESHATGTIAAFPIDAAAA